MRSLRSALSVCALAVGACSPTLNWRDTQPEGSGLRLTFPCKPSSRTREVVLAGKPVVMRLHSCDAGGATFALTVAELPNPSLAASALDALEHAAGSNIDATTTSKEAFAVKGMTPTPAAQRLISTGRLPDGASVRQEAAFFISGSRVYQATILDRQDKRLAADAADTFFESVVLTR